MLTQGLFYLNHRRPWRSLTRQNTGLDNFTISKKRLGHFLNHESYNPYEIALIGLFLDVPPKEMANPRLPEKSQTEMFDSNVKELRKKGFNILEIARQMKIHHQIISNVLKGVYEVKGPQGIKNKPSKWDWKKIDKERSAKLPSLIRELRKKGISITKSVIAKELKLKDVSLRNLPNVKRGIKLLKN